MKEILLIYNTLLSLCYYLFYPILWLVLRKHKYLDAIRIQGKDTCGGVLFHAASMGEVAAVKPLLLRVLSFYPDLQIAITTTSLPGLKLAKEMDPRIGAYLSSLDIKHLKYKQLNTINPKLICIVETEIWPNMLLWADRHKVPVLFMNARMSQRSLSRYMLIKPVLNALGKPIKEIHAKSGVDAERFRHIFHKPVFNSGCLKFALELPEYNAVELRNSWGYAKDDFIICWGSSRPGEEALIASILPSLGKRIENLKLVIAIRHPARIEEVKKELQGLSYRLLSESADSGEADILVIDKMGVLEKAYALCDLAIIGGSFFDFGGHNPLEAAYYAKPIIIGLYHQSCNESVQKLLDGQGIIVSNQEKLKEDILSLAGNRFTMTVLGDNAKKTLTENSRSLINHFTAIQRILD